MEINPMEVGGAILATVVWFVRLEGRIKAVEREGEILTKFVYSLDSQHKAFADKISQDLASVKESLARIEGKLSAQGDFSHG